MFLSLGASSLSSISAIFPNTRVMCARCALRDARSCVTSIKYGGCNKMNKNNSIEGKSRLPYWVPLSFLPRYQTFQQRVTKVRLAISTGHSTNVTTTASSSLTPGSTSPEDGLKATRISHVAQRAGDSFQFMHTERLPCTNTMM